MYQRLSINVGYTFLIDLGHAKRRQNWEFYQISLETSRWKEVSDILERLILNKMYLYFHPNESKYLLLSVV